MRKRVSASSVAAGGRKGGVVATTQPEHLMRGSEFERAFRARARNIAGDHPDALILHEDVISIDGHRRRVDLLLDPHVSDPDPLVVVVELKSCDWERMRPGRAMVNVRRHATQVLRYVDGWVGLRHSDAAAGIVYERSPGDSTLAAQIEALLDSLGIQTIWADRNECWL
jgi:hypothetical protein